MKIFRKKTAPGSSCCSVPRSSVWAVILVFASMFSIFAGPVQSQTFPTKGDDVTGSMGLFRITVDSKFQALMSIWIPPAFYNSGTFKFTSPVMVDPSTEIGRSSPFANDAPDTGALVGSDDFRIKDSDMTFPPGWVQGPGITREVHTRVKKMDLQDFMSVNSHVRAGSAAPLQPTSPGEVESKNVVPGMTPDFPAESFFDIFVEVDFPTVSASPPFNGGVILYNKATDPLLVANDTVLEFPPRVVYVHEGSSAVPIYFKTAKPGYWDAGMLFGHLVLAGHEPVDSTKVNDPDTIAKFVAYMDTIPELPLPLCLAKPGDANANNTYALSDVISIVNYIFPKAGCTPLPNALCWLSGRPCRGDWNGSTSITLGDVIQAVNYMFNKPGGPWFPVSSGVCCIPYNAP